MSLLEKYAKKLVFYLCHQLISLLNYFLRKVTEMLGFFKAVTLFPQVTV